MYLYLFQTWKLRLQSKVCNLVISFRLDDSLNFNTMETRPEEYQSGTFYQESPSYPMIQQEIPPRGRDQRVSAISGVSMNVSYERQEEIAGAIDYHIPNSFGVIFKPPPSQKVAPVLPFSQPLSYQIAQPMKETLIGTHFFTFFTQKTRTLPFSVSLLNPNPLNFPSNRFIRPPTSSPTLHPT